MKRNRIKDTKPIYMSNFTLGLIMIMIHSCCCFPSSLNLSRRAAVVLAFTPSIVSTTASNISCCRISSRHISSSRPATALAFLRHYLPRQQQQESLHHSSCLAPPAAGAARKNQKSFLTITPTSTTTTRTMQSSTSLLIDFLEKDNDIITSTKSKTIKLYQQLISKSKARSQHQMTVLEGYRLVMDTLTHPKSRNLYRNVLVTKEALEHPTWGNQLSQALEELWKERKEQQGQQQQQQQQQQLGPSQDSFSSPFRIQLVTEQVLKSTCDTVTPQGIMALLDIPPSYRPPQQQQQQQQQPNKIAQSSKLFLILDGISDPGNVGTLFRSSMAVGVECVVLLPGSCDVWNPKAVRSAMGTTFHVPVYYAESWEGCLDALEKWGVSPTTSRGERVYAATMWMEEESGGDGNDDDNENYNGANGKMEAFSSKAHFEVDWCGGGNGNRGSAAAAALVLGKEGPGLSLQVRESVAKGEIRSVYVPMEAGIESLNVGTCGSVIMFEYYRQKLCTSRSLGVDGDDVNG